MSKIREVFGKNTEITISDIENGIKSGRLNENDEIELKDSDRYINEEKLNTSTKRRKKAHINKIISELVSFLNSGRGVGLLILGLGEKDSNITIKGVKAFKNKEQIRSSIYDKICTIPSNIKTFKLEIIPVKYNNGNIFLIEVGSNDLDCIYYSKVDNNVYIRQGDETKSLTLPNFLELISKKNHARIFLKFNQKPNNNIDSYMFDITYKNEGLEPGMYITSKFEFITADGLNFSVESLNMKKQMDSTVKLDGTDIIEDGNIVGTINSSKLNIETENNSSFVLRGSEISTTIFQCNVGYPPNTMPIYPSLDGLVGKLSIEKKDFEMIIKAYNYENRGYTRQSIIIKSENDNITITELDKKFKPYLSI